LNEKGEILLGAGAVSRFGKHDAAILLFDEVNASIGLLPSNLRNKNAYPLKRKGQNEYRVVQAARFCRHHNIRVDRRIKFNTPELDPEGILILDLKKTTAIGRLSKPLRQKTT